MLYRALNNLSIGIKRGEVFSSRLLKPENAEILLEVRAIAKVHAPPIIAVEGWEERVEVLESAGLVDLAEVVECDPDDIPGVAREIIEVWQIEALVELGGNDGENK